MTHRMSIGVRLPPCTTPPLLASPAARALSVIAAMVATLAVGGDSGPNVWRVAGDAMPGQAGALLGLALAILVGSAATLAAHATVQRSALPSLAMAGALLATLAAPASATVSLPILAILAAAYCLATRTRAATLTTATAMAGLAVGGVAGCALVAISLYRLLRADALLAANDNIAPKSAPMWRPVDPSLEARLSA